MSSALDLFGDEINNTDGDENNAEEYSLSHQHKFETNQSTIIHHSTDAHSSMNNPEPWGELVLVSEKSTNPRSFLLFNNKHIIGRGKQKADIAIGWPDRAKSISRQNSTITKVNEYTFEIKNDGTSGTVVNGLGVLTHWLRKTSQDSMIDKPIKSGEYATVKGKTRSHFKTTQDWTDYLSNQLKDSPVDITYRFLVKDTIARANNVKRTPDMPGAFEMARFMSSDNSPIPSMLSVLRNPSQKTVPTPSTTVTEGEKSAPLSTIQTITQAPESSNKRKFGETEIETIDQDSKKFKLLSQSYLPELTCTCCQGLFVRPFLLECGHNFCEHCLYKKLKKEKKCPLCSKGLRNASCPNSPLEKITQAHVESLSQEEIDEHEKRKKAIQIELDAQLGELHTMIGLVKADNKKFFNIKDKWKPEDKRFVRRGLGEYFGKCREEYCNIIGLTKGFCDACLDKELVVACDNLEIPLCYTVTGRDVKSMTRVVDWESTRQRLIDFTSASDNIFFI